MGVMRLSKVEPWSQATQPMQNIRGRAFQGGKRPLIVLSVLLAVLGLTAAGLAFYSSTYNGRIYRGVSVMGVDVSGQTPAQAREALLAHSARYADSPLTLTQQDLTWNVTPRELGLELDVDPLVQQAYTQGRSGSLLDKWSQRVPVVGASTDIQGRYILDRGKIESYVQGLTGDVARKPVDSALSLNASGELVATQERAGQQLDTDAAVIQLQNVVNQLEQDEVALPVLVVPPSQTREEWRDAQALGAAIATQPLQLRFKDQEWTLSPSQLRKAIVAEEGGEVVGRFDTAKMERLLAPVAADIKRKPVDASLKIKEGAAVLSADKAGQRLNAVATMHAVYTALSEDGPATVVAEAVPVKLTAADLAPAKKQLDTMLGSPLTLTHGASTWAADPETVATWVNLDVDPNRRSASVKLSNWRIKKYLGPIGDEMRREPVDARLEIENGEPLLVREVPGEMLNPDATAQSVAAALSGSHRTALSTTILPAQVTADDLQPAKQRLDALLASPVQLSFQDNTWSVTPEMLGDWTQIEVDAEKRAASVELDASLVRQYMLDLATEIYQEAADGELTWRNGLVVTRQSLDGHVLETEKATEQFLAAAFTTNHALTLPVHVTRPRVPTDDLAALGIKESIGEGTSQFTGSPPERVHNVHTAAGYLNNAVVAPGETFSFNEAIGEISLERGYQEGLTIVADQTVPGIGGGVCQVSTTTFRAAFWSGLPILERNQHSYLVSYYQLDGSPEGFDAAVYQPWADLKWRNNTDHYILVQAQWTDEDLQVVLYGTNPGVDVVRSEPVIENRIPPLPSKTIRNPALPRGTKEQKEWAHEGMEVTLTRTVSKDGKVLFEDSFYSKYKPWGDVWEVGPPKLTPKKKKPAAPASTTQNGATQTSPATGTEDETSQPATGSDQ